MGQLHLSAEAAYGFGGKQWIAKIKGRAPGAAQFEREFVGRKGGKRGEASAATVDEPGIYETCDIDRKGNKDYSYCYFDGENRTFNWFDRDWALEAAKALDSGEQLTMFQRPNKKNPAEMIWDVKIGKPEPVGTVPRTVKDIASLVDLQAQVDSGVLSLLDALGKAYALGKGE